MTAGILLLACALDAAVGDPRWWPHPVRLMGRIIVWYESSVRPVLSTNTRERMAGIALAVGLPVVCYGVAWFVIEWASRFHEVLGQGVEVWLAFTTLAARDLSDHASDVGRALDDGSLDAARRAVSRMVGRDTAYLSEEEIVRATVETIAESASDGVVAPLFFLVLGGAPLALAYKAVNTLDSMVGHLDDHYRYLGWASARLDDLANWVPARVTACLIVVSAGVVFRTGASIQRAWRMFRRDGAKHASPNSGHPEAAMAGALGVQLGGISEYEGVAMARPVMGDRLRPLALSCIHEALRIMWTVFLMGTVLAAAALWL